MEPAQDGNASGKSKSEADEADEAEAKEAPDEVADGTEPRQSSAHSVTLEDLGPSDSTPFSAVVEVAYVPSDTVQDRQHQDGDRDGAAPEPEAEPEPETASAHAEVADAAVSPLPSEINLEARTSQLSNIDEASDAVVPAEEDEEVGGEEAGEAAEPEEVPDEPVALSISEDSGELAEPVLPEKDDSVEDARSEASTVVSIEERLGSPEAGPPPVRVRPSTLGILDKTVWQDPEVYELREELRVGFFEPPALVEEVPRRAEEVPHWDAVLELPRNLNVRHSASHVTLPSLRRQLSLQRQASRGGYVPVVDVHVEEHESDTRSSATQRLSDTRSLRVPGPGASVQGLAPGDRPPALQKASFLSPTALGVEGSSRPSPDRMSRVEFTSSVETVYDDTEGRGVGDQAIEEEPAILEEVAEEAAEEAAEGAAEGAAEEAAEVAAEDAAEEAAEEVEPDAPAESVHAASSSVASDAVVSDTAVSDTPALETELQIEEEVASLRAELQEAREGGPAITTRVYQVAVRAEQGEDVLLQLSTSAGRLFSKVYKIHANMLELKEDLAAFFNCSVADIAVDASNLQMEDSLPLAGAGVEYHDVALRIRVARPAKPFLGGWRDSRAGLEFHHAESQTGPPPQDVSAKASREVQAVRPRKKRVHMPRDKATQVPRPDLYIPGLGDRVLTADATRYVPADAALAELEAKVRAIQRCYRAYLQRRVDLRGGGEDQGVEEDEEVAAEKDASGDGTEVDEEDREERALILAASTPSAYPRTREDFATLYALVERWRDAVTQRLRASHSEAARRAMLAEVLAREVVLLKAIERHKQVVLEERREEERRRFLKRCAQPLEFEGSHGAPIQVETMGVAKARELQAAYASLTCVQADKQERIATLLPLMDSLKEVGSERAEELRRLIGRECTLLARDMDRGLDALRRRIALLFAEMVKSPAVNPEAAKHLHAHQVARLVDNVTCAPCGAFLPLEAFPLHSNSRVATHCGPCEDLYNAAGPRVDHRPVHYVMEAVRRDEQRRSAYSSVAFIMQPRDFKVLLDLWLARSLLTEKDAEGLWGLRLPRWRPDEEWSPWNCVLLTAAEARAHTRHAQRPEEVYGPALVATARRRHLQAKKIFARLLRSERLIREQHDPVEITVADG